MNATSKPFTNVNRRRQRKNKQDPLQQSLVAQAANAMARGDRRTAKRDLNAAASLGRPRRARAARAQSIGSVIAAAPALVEGAMAVAGGVKTAWNAGKALVKQAQRLFATSEESYLYGFVDPENAAPGPGDGVSATYVVKHRSYTDYSVFVLAPTTGGVNAALATANDASDTAPAEQPLGTPNDAFYQAGRAYIPAVGAPITFLACPHAVRTEVNGGSAAGNWNFYVAGAAISQVRHQDPMYANEFYQAYPILGIPPTTHSVVNHQMPMNKFDIEPFYGPAVSKKTFLNYYVSSLGDASIREAKKAFVPLIRRRTVGLKLEVTCNFPALTTSGEVVGGDNRHVFGQQTEMYRHDPALGFDATATNPVASEATMSNDVLQPNNLVSISSDWAQSRRDLGALSHGATYEAQFMPAGDHIMAWQTNPAASSAAYYIESNGTTDPMYIPASGVPDGSRANILSWADLLMNNPMCYITVTGAPSGCTFRTRVTWAVEYTVMNDGPLALVREAARFTKRFLPDWGEMTQCCSAANGIGQCCARALDCCPKLLHGMQGALGIISVEAGKASNTENYAIGAHDVADAVSQLKPGRTRDTSSANIAPPHIGLTTKPPSAPALGHRFKRSPGVYGPNRVAHVYGPNVNRSNYGPMLAPGLE
jgi:hypothetical protein